MAVGKTTPQRVFASLTISGRSAVVTADRALTAAVASVLEMLSVTRVAFAFLRDDRIIDSPHRETFACDHAVVAAVEPQRVDLGEQTPASTSAWFIFTDSRNGIGCPAVDADQQYLVSSGLVIREDGADVMSQRVTGINPALTDPVTKPAPGKVCPAQFGNTDLVVAQITP